jgi:rSAM/selenodomain-associated transferase 2
MLVSVIIPTLNEAQNIRQTIRAARREYDPNQVEVIVSDGGSTDGTLDLVPDDVTLVHAPRGRAVQMNHGADESRGEIIVFCHADSKLPSGWRQAVIDALADPSTSGGTFQTLILPAKGLLHIRNHLRFPANWKIMFGDQVQFMRRETLAQIGGFPEIPLMEDVEMSRSLHKVGKLVRLPLRVTTSSRRFLERGVLRQTIMNGISMFRYLYLGATPQDIAKTYRSSREESN